MSDQNIQIGITTTADTTGAKDTQAAIHSMDAEVARSANTIEQAAEGPIKKHTEKTKEAHVQTKNWGMAANAMSYQMQDFSVQVGGGTSAITAFAQQAPQLIDGMRMAGVLTGGVGMAMMGVSAAVPIVMFGGKALWENFSTGAGQAKKKTDELFQRLDEVGKIYQGFEDVTNKAREKAADGAAADLRRALAENNTRSRISKDTTAIQSTVDTLNAQLELARERINLSRIEAGLSSASGADVLRLAKEREASVMRIYDTEVRIAEISRETALANARRSAEDAAADFEKLKQANQPAYDNVSEQRRKVAELQARLEELQSGTALAELYQKMAAKAIEYQDASRRAAQEGGLRGGADLKLVDSLHKEFEILRQQFEKADKQAPQDIADTAKQLEISNKTLESMESKAESITVTIAAAAKLVSAAMASITKEKSDGEAQKTIGGQIKGANAEATAEKAITEAAKKGISLSGGAQARKPVVGGFPGMDDRKEVTQKLSEIVSDNKPDAGQAQSILTLLETLKSNLGAKDADLLTAFNSLITTVNSSVNEITAIKGRTADLESKATQGR